MTRAPLDRAIRDPGFTPSTRDLGALVELLTDDDLVKHAERAIGRLGSAAFPTLADRFAAARPPLRGRVLRVIGRLADEALARALLVAALDDVDPKTRRNAAIALGHTRAEGVEDALLAACSRDTRVEMHRSIAASLGKVGSGRSLGLLREAALSDDKELARIAERGASMIDRTQSRAQRGRLDPTRAPNRPVEIEAMARRGVEGMLAEELSGCAGITDVRVVEAGRVRALLAGPMSSLFRASTMLAFRFPLPREPVGEGEAPEEAIARAAASAEAGHILSTWTVGAVRYRLAWDVGGHKRAAAWRTASAVARRAPAMVNDPTASLWEFDIATTSTDVEVSLVPRAVDDPRFPWRRRDVPAASHPTIAAALARLSGVRPDDVVWDPFVGSGAELIERGLAGPYATLLGSDIDPKALAAARENLTAAGVIARLEQCDALAHAPKGVTLVITNPPMGRRATRVAGLYDLLDGFVAHAATVLQVGGRLAWVAPSPKRARAAAERAGLRLDWARIVDMGGFDAEMQLYSKS